MYRPTPPLLRDVIVHYQEKQHQASLGEVYRLNDALSAIYGADIHERTDQYAKDLAAKKTRRRRSASSASGDPNTWISRLRQVVNKPPPPG